MELESFQNQVGKNLENLENSQNLKSIVNIYQKVELIIKWLLVQKIREQKLFIVLKLIQFIVEPVKQLKY